MVEKFNMTRNELIAGYNTQEELVAELLAACKLALIELDRIGSDIGFEPDRYQERLNALDALSRAVNKAGE